MENKETALAKQPEQWEQKALAVATEIKKEDFYRVGGKEIPSAKVWNKWAQDAGIKTEYIRDAEGKPCAGADENKAWAFVRGTRGGQTREACVTIVFKDELEKLVFDAIQDRTDRYTGKVYRKGKPYEIIDNKPCLTQPADQIEVLREFNRIKAFGVRMATTKAEAILERKLLGADWREPEEINHETGEIEMVAQSKGQRVEKPSSDAPGSPVAKENEVEPATIPPANPITKERQALFVDIGNLMGECGIEPIQAKEKAEKLLQKTIPSLHSLTDEELQKIKTMLSGELDKKIEKQTEAKKDDKRKPA